MELVSPDVVIGSAITQGSKASWIRDAIWLVLQGNDEVFGVTKLLVSQLVARTDGLATSAGSSTIVPSDALRLVLRAVVAKGLVLHWMPLCEF